MNRPSSPNYIVAANNVNIFKRRLDAYWQDHDIIGLVKYLDMNNSFYNYVITVKIGGHRGLGLRLPFHHVYLQASKKLGP